MKPTNPMAQLEQWKKNNEQAKINQFVNEMNQSKIDWLKVTSSILSRLKVRLNSNLRKPECKFTFCRKYARKRAQRT